MGAVMIIMHGEALFTRIVLMCCCWMSYGPRLEDKSNPQDSSCCIPSCEMVIVRSLLNPPKQISLGHALHDLSTQVFELALERDE